jgi:hypothetical protein
MSQSGGRAAKRKRMNDDPDADVPKVQKGTLRDLFTTYPIDVTTEKSKYETYTQTQVTTDPLEIVVTKTRSWVDLTRILFEYEVEFTANDGTTLLTALNKVFPANNIGHTLIKQFDMYVNKDLVGESSENYHIPAYFDRLLNHSEDEKATWLSMEGWSTDTAGKFDLTDPLVPGVPDFVATNAAAPTSAEIRTFMGTVRAQVQPNEGAKQRHGLCCQGRKVKFMIKPNIGLLNCDRYLMPGAQLDFRIKWNSPQLALMTDGTISAPKFRIVPFSPKIYIRHMDANNELHIHNESQMLTQQRIGIFPHFGKRLVTQTFVDGRRKGYFHNVFQGYRPNYMHDCWIPER